jgi:hypothetical protein
MVGQLSYGINMQIERTWAMPNKWTFTILPIKKLLLEVTDDYSNWVDPFAGMTSPCGISNDIRPEMPTTYHGCALEFLKSLPSRQFDGVLYDPPYSISQAKECYEGAGMKNLSGSMRWWADIKDEIARIIKPRGTAICFGWSSNGIGKCRGFTMTKVLIVPHGGSKNDTICTIETKVSNA